MFELRTVTQPVVDIIGGSGARERQLLLGAKVNVTGEDGSLSSVTSATGYTGHVPTWALGANVPAPTHMVSTLATHAFETESFKSRDLMHLPFGAQVTVLDERHKFFETNVGFISKKHLRALDHPFADPVTVAQLHFGVPYLWGGNSSLGIDCSGLVSTGLRACGIECPDDSGFQRDTLGTYVTGDFQRGDLLFWKGHVGIMVDDQTMIHANAHHMATAYEPIDKAILRIKAQGEGELLAHKRL